MVLSDKGFEHALRSVRRHGKGEKALRRLRLEGEVGETVRRWARDGVQEMEPTHAITSGEYRYKDGIGQEMNVHKVNPDDEVFQDTRSEWLFVGMAQANVPEWSRQNIGGLALRDLATQCGVQWTQYRGGYKATLTKQHWYAPSAHKKFLNRYYTDQRAEILKRVIINAHPKAVVWVPSCPVESLHNELVNFMYKERFHPTRVIFLSGDRQYPVGKCQYRSNTGRDMTFLNGVSRDDKLPVPKSFKVHGYDRLKRSFGDMRVIRVGIGDHVPDDPFVVFSEKERNFVMEYQFPVIQHALFLFASGMSQLGQECLQRDIDEMRRHVEDVEQSHSITKLEISDEDTARVAEDDRQRLQERQAVARLDAQREQAIRSSALGRFMKKRGTA